MESVDEADMPTLIHRFNNVWVLVTMPSSSLPPRWARRCWSAARTFSRWGTIPVPRSIPASVLLDQLLALAERLATRTAGHPMRVRTVTRVQYLDAILPGDVVDLEATRANVRAGRTFPGSHGECSRQALCAGQLACGTPCAAIELPAVAPPQAPPVLTHRQIAALLPHRYPFLLIDAVQGYTAGAQICACKLATRQSPLFAAQTPDVYPAGLAIESLGQAGIALFFLGRAGEAPSEVVLGAMNGIELIHDVPFDSVLTLDARIDRLLPNAVVFGGEIRIGPTPVIRVGSLVAMIDPRHAPLMTPSSDRGPQETHIMRIDGISFLPASRRMDNEAVLDEIRRHSTPAFDGEIEHALTYIRSKLAETQLKAALLVRRGRAAAGPHGPCRRTGDGAGRLRPG